MREWLEAFILHSSVFRQGRNALCLLMALPIVILAGEDKSGQKTQPANHLAGPDARASRPRGDTTAPPASQAQLVEAYGKLPLRFEANQGQTDRQVKFLSRGRGYGLFLTPTEAVLALQGESQKSKVKSQNAKSRIEDAARSALQTPNSESSSPAVLRMKLVGANPNPEIQGLEELPGKSNYFIGNDPKQWRTGVPNFGKVRHESVYPGVDLVYYGNQGQLEYDWVVAPGADPKTIKFAIEGTEKVSIDPKGDLVLQIEGGEVRFHKPVVYQEQSPVVSNQFSDAAHLGQPTTDSRKMLDGRYTLRLWNPESKIPNPKWEVGFDIASYDPAKPLVIDPVLTYSTYLGGSGSDQAYGIAVDSAFNAYVVGSTASADFPTQGPVQGYINGEAFLTKLSADASTLVYSTYLGGRGDEYAYGITVDTSGNAYVTGSTNSANYPTTVGAFQTSIGGTAICWSSDGSTSFNCYDAFVTKLNPAGNALVYSTYLGGSAEDEAMFGIQVDGTGNLYLAGVTDSSNFPTTPGAYQTALGGGTCGTPPTTYPCNDAFVTKLNAAGSALVYSTLLGGNGYDSGYGGVAVDASGNAYVAGYTAATNFPALNPYQAAKAGGYDAFVTKLNATGTGLLYSTHLGGSTDDYIHGIALDASNKVYVTGFTYSSDFPTKNPIQASYAGSLDAFVTKIDPSQAGAASLIYSTYLGGNGFDYGRGIAVDVLGNAYVTGNTNSTNLPTANAIQPSNGGAYDAFLTKVNAAGSALIFSTYFGGSSNDNGTGVAVDSQRNAYFTGLGNSTDLPTTVGAFQTTFGGTVDAFVAKFAGLALPVVTVNPGSLPSWGITGSSVNVGVLSPPQPVTITNLGDATLNFSSFNVGPHPTLPGFGDFPWDSSLCGTSLAAGASCIVNVRFNPSAPGDRGGVLTITDDSGGVPGTTQTVTVTGFGTQPIISTTPTSPINFGAVLVGTDSAAAFVNIGNGGDGPLNVAAIVSSPFLQTAGGCSTGSFVVSPDTSCDLFVIFHPTIPGFVTGTLTINSDDPTKPVTIVSLSGTGISGGVVAGLPPRFPFGSLLIGKTSSVQRLTLNNNFGSGPLGINNIVVTGNFDLAPSTTCPIGGSLAVGTSCFIDLTFSPESLTNPGALQVYHDGTGSPAIVALSGTGTTLPTNALVAFTPKTDYPTATTPFAGAGEDLNSDGKFDLVAANYGSNNVSVFLGNGDGTFQSHVDYPAGTNPTSVEISDVTGDGIFDLIVTDQNAANPAAGAVQILAGNGNGTFQPAVSLGTFNGPNSVVSANFNHDGIRDLAIAEGGGGAGTTVAVLLGTGGGNFQSPVYHTVPTNPASIVGHDFNGDGNPDLAVLSNIGSLSILLGNGDGTFQTAVSYPTGSFPNGRMAIADFNGDGSPDIAVAQNGSDSVGVFLNDGTGAFPTRIDYAATGARAVTVADFNGDGKFDLAVAGQSAGVVWILIGNGDGTFRTPAVSFPTTPAPKDVGGVDFNGDGMPDLAVAGSLSILLNTNALFNTYNLTFGNQLVGTTSSPTRTITLQNASNSTSLNVGGITPSGDFSDTVQTCTANPIPPGGSCTISANFTPTALGLRTGTLSISSDAVGSPHIINLTGTGTGTPAMTLTTVNFPGNPVGYSLCPTKDVTVTNAGDIPLTFVGAAFSPGSPFTVTNDCPATLAVGESLACLHVKFIPTAEGITEDLLTVTTSPASTGNTVVLTGTGTPACTLLAKVRSTTLLRGTDAQDFEIADGKPSCSPVNLNLSCSVANPAACALNPAVIAPSGSSTLRVSNLKAVTADSVAVQVNSLSEFRTASELISVRFSDFAFTSAPATANVLAGETASYSLAIRPVNGLAGPLALSCSGAPRGATCTVTPSAVTLDGSALAQVKVRVTTTARAGGLGRYQLPPLGGHRGLPLLLLALLLTVAAARVGATLRGRGIASPLRLVLGVALLAMLLWASCGGGGSRNFNSGGTPAGTFTLTITGTYTAAPGTTPATLSNATALTLKVN